MGLIKTPKSIYTHLKNRQQCVRIYVCSEFKEIISGVPQGSIVRPILFNAFQNDFFYTIEKAPVRNFADDNTLLSVFTRTIHELVHLLTAIKWFSENKMIVNPNKFKAIVISKTNLTIYLLGSQSEMSELDLGI